jgi:hypothetical protein
MRLLKALARRVSLTRFFAYLRLRQDRRSYYYTLSKVTRLESARDLRSKIHAIDLKLSNIYKE